jgi:hypothetical protein
MKSAVALFVTMAATMWVVPFGAHAVTVDLSGWSGEDWDTAPGFPATKWTVQGPANNSVFQTDNFSWSVFFNPGNNSQGKALSGEVTVETSSDDDFIGFALGYSADEFASKNADFWLIDWKQTDQPFYGNEGSAGSAGMALSHYTGDVSSAPTSDLWNHVGVVEEVQRAATLGRTGWEDFRTYSFELVFTPSLIELKVDGVTELSYSGRFESGAYGFHTASQSNVRYAEIAERVVPVPAALPLLLAGLGALGFLRRRRLLPHH